MSTHFGGETIAFICAMPIELAPLVRLLSLTETDVNGVKMHAGTLDGRPVTGGWEHFA